ncbi:hypothetical protein [Thermovibrio sp.]
MRFKKLIVGLVFLTVFTCGYTPAGYSFSFESSPKVEITLKKVHEESLSEQELERRGEGSSTPLIYSFLVKIDHRFYSSPPRASP